MKRKKPTRNGTSDEGRLEGPSKEQGNSIHMRRVCLACLVILLIGAVSGMAQKKKKSGEQTRSVSGVVTNQDDVAVNGAVVQIKNTKNLQIRSFITQKDGTYYFHGLNTDTDYELKADYSGASSATRTLSSFDTRMDATMNLKLNPKK